MNFLAKIIEEKNNSVKEKKGTLSLQELKDKVKFVTVKSRFKEILRKPALHLIAEIKRASPSKGDLRKDLDVARIANVYQKEGIGLVSVLTEEKFFKGSLDDLSKVRDNTSLSILRKDFIIDEYQIYEAKLYGADAVLLIARILSAAEIEEFINIAKTLDIDPLVEVHTQEELEKALKIKEGVDIIGINHRNLDDFSIDLKISEDLVPKIPKDKLVIVESGIESAAQVKRFKKMGVNGVLIGESLMREEDISRKLKELISATK
ncbi:MAG: indole-3-glycerol phosphate synthase TrpC [Candidatus Omnitrophica bacterium]|nr:indole-3-glycerol phosphate synthase TrpC [Candidatus Omnitrophota bacterium]MDD5355677.1 indole-3-glycerol phosphate synthase TrpC [Candidatus Omnitrophota bacterium]